VDVLVSGASGLIGTALSRTLVGGGHRVVRLRRGGTTEPDDIGWDPGAGRIDAPALEDLDAVVHLAGESIGEKRWTDDEKRRIRESRTRGTSLLVGALASRDRKPRVLVSASAIGYYGDRGEERLTEQSAPGDDFLAGVCAQWEAATTPAADAGIRVVNVRSGVVLARNGGALARMLLPFRLGLGGRVGPGTQYMSWISIDDEVNAIVHAIEKDAVRGPMNAVGPNPVTNREFTSTLAHVLHRPALLPTPLAPLKAWYGPELVESLLLFSQRVEPSALRGTGYEFRHPSLEAALRAVLDRPTS
jgi:uncharacterized protein (TIGR01777 family)